ncbi:uncharacterized protein [Linepithema humile]|uniref:uncharacterized protein n=1 Tax=Linepithema humile TaxID=83485 RepID=UPI00351EDDA9
MASRAKLLIQKRKALKSQLTNLTNLIEKDQYDRIALKIRMERITELFHAYEDFNDELILLEPDDNHDKELTNIQERFYAFASKIKQLTSSNTRDSDTDTVNDSVAGTSNDAIADISNNTIQHNNSNTITVIKRRIKLPEATLPNFDGRYENWLTFKNTFVAMIDTRTDLSDVDKFQYLQSTLKDEAANKIKFLAIDGSSYHKPWELLRRAYEVNRILISRHLSLLIKLPILEKETYEGLSRLADDVQQHVASLAALGVNVGSEILVNILESKLPKNTAEKWEETLSRDEFPKIDELYEFLYRTAVRVSKRARVETHKREDNKNMPPVKRTRLSNNKAFVVNVSNNCAACKTKQHPLFKCDKFKQLSVPKRIDLVKGAKLCYNCLQNHRGKICGYGNCNICQKRHNTLLHIDNYANKHTNVSTKTDSTDSKIKKTA